MGGRGWRSGVAESLAFMLGRTALSGGHVYFPAYVNATARDA